MGFLKAAGQRLHFELIEGANPSAPTLVMLHHGLGCVELWYDTPQKLSDATGCSVFTYSRQGYGQSEPCTKWPRSVRYMQDEAIEVLPHVLEAAGLDDVILVGHSDGATIALVYGGNEPKGVRGIVAIAPHFFLEDICTRAITKIDAAYENGLKQKLARYHTHVDGAFYGWSKSWLQPDFVNFNTEEYLPTLQVPTLGIQGLDDEYGTLKQLECLEEKAGGPVEIVTLADCGHMAHRDQPEKLVELISGFVRKLI